jgi:hypothetical protein
MKIEGGSLTASSFLGRTPHTIFNVSDMTKQFDGADIGTLLPADNFKDTPLRNGVIGTLQSAAKL